MGVKIREKIKGSGEWWVYINHRGVRKAKKAGSKKTAKEIATQVEARLVLGDLNMQTFNETVPTFKQYAEKWLALPHTRKETTQRQIRRNLELHVYPVLGNMAIDKIKQKHLKALFDSLAMKGMSTVTFQTLKAPLHHVFNSAIVDEFIEHNPLKGLTHSNKSMTEINPLNEQDAFTFLEGAKAHRGGLYYPHLLTLLRAGLRVGELLGLQWNDLDFENRSIKVERQVHRGVEGPTKSKKSRVVDMTPHTAETLKALKKEKAKEALKKGKPLSPWVFTLNGKRPMRPSPLKVAIDTITEKAGLHHLRIHDLRHSYCTIRLMKGHSLGDVSSQMGHANLNITLKVYTHWIPNKFKHQVDDLDLQPTATQPQPAVLSED